VIEKVSRLLHDSIAYALNHRQEALDYALQFGRGLDRAKADKFVGMYVNELTLEYGDRGRKAVQLLFDEAWDKRLIPKKLDIEYSA
jgi:1,4-dihydroxy-6-naphthoate synthase